MVEDVERLEIELLLEAVYRHYGYDFRGYAYASLKRRIRRLVEALELSSISELQARVLHDPLSLQRLVGELSVTVTSMFRDPILYLNFREKVVPLLRTYPFVRIWHAGCSTGEEVYSLAIVLQEAGLHDRTRIYATDMNEAVLRRAEEGVIPIRKVEDYSANYQKSGGTRRLSDYWISDGPEIRLRRSVLRNVVFAQHNLVSDRGFNAFNVVMCRNVLIYFGKELQQRVHSLLYESLEMFGVLALGYHETLRFSDFEPCYEELDGHQKMYRKVR